MSPEAQRIAIAEACGWYRAPYEDSWYESAWRKGSELVGEHALPDYLNDLNAMHDAEKVLLETTKKGDWRGWDSIRINLEEMVGKDDVFHATAAQRAEAFLRTLNLWDDSK